MQLTDGERQALVDFLIARSGEPILKTLKQAAQSIFGDDRQDALARLIADRRAGDNLGVVNDVAIQRFLEEITLYGETKDLHISLNQKGSAERLAVWMRDGQHAQLTIRHNQGTFSRVGIAEGLEVESGILCVGDVLFIEYWQNGLQAYALLKYSGPGNVTVLYSEGFAFTPYAIGLHQLKEEARTVVLDGNEHDGSDEK
jgi:hypothetical protein